MQSTHTILGQTVLPKLWIALLPQQRGITGKLGGRGQNYKINGVMNWSKNNRKGNHDNLTLS